MITSHQIGQFKLLGKKKVKKVTKIGQEVLQHDHLEIYFLQELLIYTIIIVID